MAGGAPAEAEVPCGHDLKGPGARDPPFPGHPGGGLQGGLHPRLERRVIGGRVELVAHHGDRRRDPPRGKARREPEKGLHVVGVVDLAGIDQPHGGPGGGFDNSRSGCLPAGEGLFGDHGRKREDALGGYTEDGLDERCGKGGLHHDPVNLRRHLAQWVGGGMHDVGPVEPVAPEPRRQPWGAGAGLDEASSADYEDISHRPGVERPKGHDQLLGPVGGEHMPGPGSR